MGKSNRIRSMRENERNKVLGVKNRKKGMPSWALTLITVTVAVAILLSSAGILLAANGVFGRIITVARSDDYRMSANMLAYFYSSQYQNFYSSYGSYGIFSLDTSKPHGDQPFNPEGSNDTLLLEEGEETPETWRDYFMSLAVKKAKSVLVYCEAAEDYDIELGEEDYKEIDTAIDQFAAEGEENGYSLNNVLAIYFGEGVSESDVRKCMEYELLASKVATAVGEKIDSEITSDDIDAAYAKGGKKFDIVNYTYYTFKVNYSDIVTKLGYKDSDLTAGSEAETKVLAAYREAITKAREDAAKLMEITDLKALQDAIYKIVAEESVEDQYTKAGVTADDKKGEDGNALVTDEDVTNFKKAIVEQVLKDIAEDKDATTKTVTTTTETKYYEYYGKAGVKKEFVDKMNTIQDSVFSAVLTATTTYNVEKAPYSEGNKFSEWAFDDARKAEGAVNTTIYHQYDGAKTGDDAKIGDTGKIDDINTVKAESKYAYVSVYMLTQTHIKDEEKSQNFSYIVFSKEADATAAAEALKDINTKDAFVAKGDEYVSAGKATFVNTAENYEKGNMGSDDLDEWLFGEDTPDNKTMAAPVKITQDSTTVYVVAYRIGDGDALWYIDVKSSVFSERSEAKDKELTEKYAVEIKDNLLKTVKVIGD